MAIVYMGSAGKPSTYRVVLKGTHCTFNLDMVSVKKGGTVSIIVYPEAGYVLSLLSTSAPCEKAFELATNTITLSKITADVVVSVDYASWSVDYAYTGARQSLLVPHTGYYEVEVAAANGGIGYNTGSAAIAKGGYIKAILPFEKERTLYVHVGGNGGGGVYTSGGGGGFGYGSGASGGPGTSGNGYTSCGGGGGGGGSKVGLDDDSVFAEASGGGGCGGHSSGNPFSATGHAGGAGGKGGGINGGRAGAGSTLVHDNSITSAHYGGAGGASATGAERIIQTVVGGSSSSFVKMKYLGIVV